MTNGSSILKLRFEIGFGTMGQDTIELVKVTFADSTQ
jgi:hypothetical protein